ncbi:hypothetical protein [Nostoc sp. NZL]|uniref:hypothetical protein n=1 Tax=Nostoc sp. NZL TaxID=2650612 RepID=UPI0018C4FF79|nr:hypothetical protein [Nostoc sp. NZL]
MNCLLFSPAIAAKSPLFCLQAGLIIFSSDNSIVPKKPDNSNIFTLNCSMRPQGRSLHDGN